MYYKCAANILQLYDACGVARLYLKYHISKYIEIYYKCAAIYCNCMTRVGAWGAVSPCGNSAWESPAPLCQSVYHPFSNINVAFIIFFKVKC